MATGEDASDIIAKLRSVSYQKGRNAEVVVLLLILGMTLPDLPLFSFLLQLLLLMLHTAVLLVVVLLVELLLP